MSTNFWELLHQRQDELTKSGRMVADYLIHHADEAQYLSISSLARACNVAEATVFRFCRALGFEGYHEMRIALAQANVTASLINQSEPEPGTTTAKLCEHASALFITAINGTQNALSPDAVDQAVDLLRAAKQVFCLGQGGSMLLANDICARFSSLSNKFRTAGDSHLQLLSASLMTEEDVVLFVSYSGATRDMMETLRTAKASGAKIILLTHYEDSPGAALADVVLLCGAQESPLDSGSIPIKVAVLYVAEVLLLRYMLDDPQQTTTRRTAPAKPLPLSCYKSCRSSQPLPEKWEGLYYSAGPPNTLLLRTQTRTGGDHFGETGTIGSHGLPRDRCPHRRRDLDRRGGPGAHRQKHPHQAIHGAAGAARH